MSLVLAAVTTVGGGCEKRDRDLFDARAPLAYPIAEGGRLVDTVSLGITKTRTFRFAGSPADVLAHQRSLLADSVWPLEEIDGQLVSEFSDWRIVARVSAAADGGAELMLDETRGTVERRERPVLERRPPGYPSDFPFVAGGRLTDETRPGVIEIDYPDESRKGLGDKLRSKAMRSEWMCTQEERRFICAKRGRSVDVTLWRKGTLLRAVFVASGP